MIPWRNCCTDHPRRFSDSVDPSTFLIGRRRPDLLAIATDRGFLGRGGSLVRNMRRAYRELLFKGEYLTGHGAPHRVAAITRSMPGQLLEKAFIGRHKFLHPRVWMRGHLGRYTSDVLLAEAERDLGSFVDASAVKILCSGAPGRRTQLLR